jgi:TDG/mug DNA glycosylase family protein
MTSTSSLSAPRRDASLLSGDFTTPLRAIGLWRTLHEVRLTPIELRPDEYAKLLDYGIGLTDLAKAACGADSNLKPADFDRVRLRAVIKTRSPRLLAFNGKTAAARYLDVPTAQINYGRQPDTIGRTAVYVCASTSPANGHWCCEPWEELARISKQTARATFSCDEP